MGYIKEPEGMDFQIQSQPLSESERKEISEFIKARKTINNKTGRRQVDKNKEKKDAKMPNA